MRRFVLVATLALQLVAASWIDDEYWTSIQNDGKCSEGRSVADFVTPVDLGDPFAEGYIAYWMTRRRYDAHRHYEAFGHAYIDDGGRICARFVGLGDEVIILCDGFRVLSRHARTNDAPFVWVRGRDANEANTIGYRSHRVAKTRHNGKLLFGDVRIGDRNYKAVTESGHFLEIAQPDVFDSEVYVLAKTTPDQPSRRHHPYDYRHPPRPYPQPPQPQVREPERRLPPPPQPVVPALQPQQPQAPVPAIQTNILPAPYRIVRRYRRIPVYYYLRPVITDPQAPVYVY